DFVFSASCLNTEWPFQSSLRSKRHTPFLITSQVFQYNFRFCGTDTPTTVIDSLNGELMVLFRANARFVGQTPSTGEGFKIGYKLIAGDDTGDVPKLELTGTGICSNQRFREGIYCIRESIRYNGNPVYKHMTRPEFLYFKNNNWVVGPEIGGETFGIQINTNTGDLMCFDGDQWVTEPSLTLEESQLCNNIW
ncbi:unnamed protein product, partial [Owenia fusiformis]